MHTVYRKPNLLFLITARIPTVNLITVTWQSLKRIPFERKLLRALKIVDVNRTYVAHAKAKFLHSFDDKPAIIDDNPNTIYQWYYMDKLHRDNDKPAYIVNSKDGNSIIERWFKFGVEHRDGDNPSCIHYGQYLDGQLLSYNRIEYKKNGLYHRDENPAIINEASRVWYQNGYLHRENNLPAVVRSFLDGTIRYDYYENGQLIRIEEINPSTASTALL